MTDSIHAILQDMAALTSLLVEELTKITNRFANLPNGESDSETQLPLPSLYVDNVVSDRGNRCYRLERARNFLREILVDGPLTSAQVYERAKKEISVSSTTMRRARDMLDLNVIHLSKGGANRFLWALKDGEVK